MTDLPQTPPTLSKPSPEDPWASWLAIYGQLLGCACWLSAQSGLLKEGSLSKEANETLLKHYAEAIGQIEALIHEMFGLVVPDDTPIASVASAASLVHYIQFIQLRSAMLLTGKQRPASAQPFIESITKIAKLLSTTMHSPTSTEEERVAEKRRQRKAWLIAEIKKSDVTIRETEAMLADLRTVRARLRAELQSMDTLELPLSPGQQPPATDSTNSPGQDDGASSEQPEVQG